MYTHVTWVTKITCPRLTFVNSLRPGDAEHRVLGLSPVWHQSITLTFSDLMSSRPLGKHMDQMWIKPQTFPLWIWIWICPLHNDGHLFKPQFGDYVQYKKYIHWNTPSNRNWIEISFCNAICTCSLMPSFNFVTPWENGCHLNKSFSIKSFSFAIQQITTQLCRYWFCRT